MIVRLFLVLIFWMVWLAVYEHQQEATAPHVQEQYYVVVPY